MSASLNLFSKSDLFVSYLVFRTNPQILISFTLATNLSKTVFLTTSFFTTSLKFKSTGTGSNLSISNLYTRAFKPTKSDFDSNLDVSIPVAFFKICFCYIIR